jgi:hypothetical protein
MSSTESHQKWDVFIAHASEDKEAFVRPLATVLQSLGMSVWYDEFSLQLGDSLSRSIDKGILGSQYGLVVVSPAFIEKKWPEYGDPIVFGPKTSNFSNSLIQKSSSGTL